MVKADISAKICELCEDIKDMSTAKWTEPMIIMKANQIIDIVNASVLEDHEVCANCPMDPVKPSWHQGKAYCGACGKRIPQKINAHYCHKCGRKVVW